MNWWRRVYGQYRLHRALHHIYVELKVHNDWLQVFGKQCPKNAERYKALIDASKIILDCIGIAR